MEETKPAEGTYSLDSVVRNHHGGCFMIIGTERRGLWGRVCTLYLSPTTWVNHRYESFGRSPYTYGPTMV